MAGLMRTLIERKKYQTQQEVVDRLNSFMVWGQITPEEYDELMLLAENTYNPYIPPEIDEPIAMPEAQ